MVYTDLPRKWTETAMQTAEARWAIFSLKALIFRFNSKTVFPIINPYIMTVTYRTALLLLGLNQTSIYWLPREDRFLQKSLLKL